MPTVIDGLILTLGLDATGAEKGAVKVDKALKKAGDTTAATGKSLDKSAKKGVEGFNGLTKSAIGFLSAIGISGYSAIKAFTGSIEGLIEKGAPLARLAPNLGLSVPTLSALSNAATIAGDSADGLKQSLEGLRTAQQEYNQFGTTSILNPLNRIGVDLNDLTGQAKPLNELLLEIGKRVKEAFPNDKKGQADWINRLGLGGALNFLEKSTEEQQRLINGQTSFGAMTQAQADAAKKAAEDIEHLKTQFSALGNDIGMKWLPVLDSMIARMERIITIVDKWVTSPEVPDEKSGQEVKQFMDRFKSSAEKDVRRIENVDAVEGSTKLLEAVTKSFFSFESDDQRKRFIDFWNGIKGFMNPENVSPADQNGLPAVAPNLEELRQKMPAAPPAGAGASTYSPQSNSVTIGSVVIYTKSEDAKGIAQEFGSSINSTISRLSVSQANSGIS